MNNTPIRRIAAIAMLMACAAAGNRLPARAGEAPAEKLLCGFEPAEFKAKNMPIEEKDGACMVLLSSDLLSYYTVSGRRILYIAKDHASEGEYAMKIEMKPGRKSTLSSDFHWRRPGTHEFPTWGAFERLFPKDWSGFSRLRMDVLCVGSPCSVQVSLEDRDIEPPLDYCFSNLPADAWATLEIDLDRAKKKGLDLAQMANFFFMPFQDTPFPTAIYLDNVRLCQAKTQSKHKLLPDPSDDGPHKPRHYAVNVKKGQWEKVNDPAPEFRKRAAPQESIASIERTRLELAPEANPHRLFIVAADARHLLVGAHMDEKKVPMNYENGANGINSGGHCAVLQTSDGGQTWRGLGRSTEASVLTLKMGDGNAGFIESDVLAVDSLGCIFALGGGIPGAAGISGYPIDRSFFKRVRFTGEEWLTTPNYLLSSDQRRCEHFASAVRDEQGRIWIAAGGSEGRSVLCEPWMKYSDDNGTTWHPWHGNETKSGLVPELCLPRSVGEYANKDKWGGGGVGTGGRAGARDAKLTLHRGKPALFVGERWAWFDGKKWSGPYEMPSPFKSRLSGNRTVWLWQALGVGNDLFIHRSRDIHRWTGEKWELEKEFPYDGAMAACGETLFFVCPEGDRQGRKNLLAWRRTGGKWEGPEKLLEKDADQPIWEVVVQPIPPADFVPVAYTSWKASWIGILKVPVKATGKAAGAGKGTSLLSRLSVAVEDQ
jgi:hypothetical protein